MELNSSFLHPENNTSIQEIWNKMSSQDKEKVKKIEKIIFNNFKNFFWFFHADFLRNDSVLIFSCSLSKDYKNPEFYKGMKVPY